MTTIAEINDMIQDAEVRLIGANGEQIGVVDLGTAKALAMENGVDLIKIVPNAKPPVCKLKSYDKYVYELKKKEKENRKNQKSLELKEIKFGPNIEQHDFMIKQNHAREFIIKGHKVRISLTCKGREAAYITNYISLVETFVNGLIDVAKLDKSVKVEGRNITATLTRIA